MLGDNDNDLNVVKRALLSPFGFYQPALGQDKILISCLGLRFFKGLDLSFLLVILFYWTEDRVGERQRRRQRHEEEDSLEREFLNLILQKGPSIFTKA